MEMIWAAFKMILAMGIGVVFLYFLIRLTKRLDLARRTQQGESGIKILTSKPIAPQKYITLVEIGGEIMALGVSAQQVTFLTKIQSREKIQELLPVPGVKPEPFSWLKLWSRGNKRVKVQSLGFWNAK
jgi:flagellar biogenesis protein FliO